MPSRLKSLVVLLMALLLTVSMCACNVDAPDNTTAATTTASTTTTEAAITTYYIESVNVTDAPTTLCTTTTTVPKPVTTTSRPTTSTTIKTTASTQITTTVAPTTVGRTIYITRTGKRYHYNPHCNGGTYYESTYEEAIRLGLTPCQKCVK